MKKVLLVDYDESHLRELKKILESFEVHVEEVKKGTEGIEKLKEGNYDLVIASTIIPGINGFEFTRKIRIELGQTKLPVILVSSIYKGSKYKYDALHVYGADHFFEFPLDEREFFSVLKKYLIEKSPTTTMKMETLHGKPEEIEELEEPPLITTDELFGDILQEVEEELETKEKSQEPQEEKEEIEKAEETRLEKESEKEIEPIEPEEILKEIIKPSPTKQKTKKKEEDFVEKILEETLSGFKGKKAKKEKIEPTPAEISKEISPQEEKTPGAEQPPQREELKPTPVEMPAEKLKESLTPKDKKGEEVLMEVIEEVGEKVSEEEPFGPLEESPVLGEYILLEKISTGGMAEVYKAKKKGVKGFEKIVALKKILPHLAEDEEFIEMFIDEAKVASKLNHPNIAQIYDLGKINGSYFIAMEYVLGKDLRTILKKIKKEKRTLPPIEISSYIIMKIAEALDYAHRKVDEHGKPLKIVHRDVSPQNILISYEGEVKLVDFGVAKASIKAHHTVAGSLKGKLLYMSPEQARGEKNLDGRSDIFSLGAVFYELLTGEKAFMAQSEAEVLDKVRHGKFKPPRAIRPDLPRELEMIIMKAMEPDPSRRYQHASEMRNDIEKFLLSYKGYIPNARDVAEYMYSLFEDEIKEAGIDVQILKQRPKRKVKVERKREEKPKPHEIKKTVKVPSFGIEEKEAREKSKALPIIIAIMIIAIIGGGIFFFLSGKKTRIPQPIIENTVEQAQPPEQQPSQENIQAPTGEEAVPQTPQEQTQNALTTQPLQSEPQNIQPPITATPKPVQKVSRPVQKPKARKLPPVKTKPKPIQKAKPIKAKQQIQNFPKTQNPAPKKPQNPPVQPPKVQPPKTENPPQTKPVKQISKTKPMTTSPQKPKITEGAVVAYPLLDKKPIPIKTVAPVRPSFPKLSGIVFMSVLIGPDGRVEQVRLIRGIQPRYDQAAIKAIKKWKFTPPIKQGIKVRTWTTITIKF